MGEVSLGTLYEINQNVMSQLPALKKHEVKDKIRNITKEYDKVGKQHSYYMLLCKERANYTVFDNSDRAYLNSSNFAAELALTLYNRGDVLDIEQTPAGYEIWIRDKYDGEVNMYMLFSCDDFIVKVRRV